MVAILASPRHQASLIQKQDNHGNGIAGRVDVVRIGGENVPTKSQDIKMTHPSGIEWMVLMLTVYGGFEGRHNYEDLGIRCI